MAGDSWTNVLLICYETDILAADEHPKNAPIFYVAFFLMCEAAGF